MRGSFKKNKKRERECGALLSHSALLLLQTIWLFALKSANLYFLSHISSLSLMFMSVHLEFPHLSLLLLLCFFFNSLALPQSDHSSFFLFFVFYLLLLSSVSFRYRSLSPYPCFILVNGKQRCHCGSILSAQRVADGRNLCRL